MTELFTDENKGRIPWNVYPRPQLKRDSFLCLNGLWQFQFAPSTPTEYTQTVTVPFPVESRLSGICTAVPENCRLYYRRSFSLPDGFNVGRVLLHFGAVDQIAYVTLNGVFLGGHIGGYGHFSFDITPYLKVDNVLEVEVIDNLDITLPYGKQRKERGGMWYTPCSGIWQTVWLESVPLKFIESISVEADDKTAKITVTGVTEGTVIFDGKAYPLKNGYAEISPDAPRLWSPEEPVLYHFTVKSGSDSIESYTAFRKLQIDKVNGIPRLLFNGKPFFFNGVLDQGYFHDGLFTPESHTCFERDILLMKEAGFNMLRKHIKVEPEQFYYDCDRLGMVVFQDMVNNGSYSFFRDTVLPTVGFLSRNDKHMHPDKATRNAFLSGLKETVNALKSHPSICQWTIFNEGWGQFNSTEAYKLLKSLDGTRFIDTASGWFRPKDTDLESLHIYFKKLDFRRSDKPVFLSEFGGYAHSVKDHVFNPNKEYGYKKFATLDSLNRAVLALYRDTLPPLIKKGLCAAVYTQLSDIEDETNGLVTYDRCVKKFSPQLKSVMDALYAEILK